MATNSNKHKLAAPTFWRRAANIVYRASRTSLYALYVGLTLLVSFILLASAFSDMISPTVWIIAAYIGLAFPVVLLCALLWLLFMIVTRRWHAVLLLVVAFLLCSVKIWRYSPLHFVNPDPVTNEMVKDGVVGHTPVDTFKVLTFNTLMLGNAKVNKEEIDIPAINLVRRCGADVICLQEFHIGTSKKGYTLERFQNLVKKEYPYSHFVLNYGSKATEGIMIYSKWPFKSQEEIDLSGKINYHAAYDILNVRGREVVLVHCHLRTNEISKENRQVYKDQTKHFEVDSLKRMGQGMKQLIPSFITRTEQVATINRYLAEHEKKGIGARPTLICGDLNDTPNSFAYRALRGDLIDTWEEAGFGPGITFREAPFWFRIDHIFHSEHFRTLDVKVLREEKSSDHYPVMATFQLLPVND